MKSHGTRHDCVWPNAPATHEWFEHLQQSIGDPESDNEPLTWIKDLTQLNPSNRPKAGQLVNQIRISSSMGYFTGACCLSDSDEDEDYPSSPSSTHSEEYNDDFNIENLDIGEKPFASLVAPSRQNTIEQWLDFDSNHVPGAFIEAESSPQQEHLGNIYEISRDASTQDTASVYAESHDDVTGSFKLLDQCEGYDIIQDESDEEVSYNHNSDQAYEVLEDNSGSEVTIRQSLSGRPRSEDPSVVVDSIVRGRADSGDPMSSEVSEAEMEPLLEEPVLSDNVPKLPSIVVSPAVSPPNMVVIDHGPDMTHPTAASTSLLNAASLAKLSGPKQKVNKKANLSVLLAEPQISPSVYMQEVWEAASSAPTSMISEGTRKKLNVLKASGIVWQDSNMKSVEQFAKLGKAAALREFLEAGCNPGTKLKPRRAPLMIAVKGASQRHNKCVIALLDAGANVNVRDTSGRSPLHYAIEHEFFIGYTDLIRDLLQAGADPNVKHRTGDFPLLQILYDGYEPLKKHRRDTLACLLRREFDADVNVMPPGTLNMPLHLAIRRKDPWAVGL